MPYIDQETKLMIMELHDLMLRHDHTLYGEKQTKDNGLCGDVARNRNAIGDVDKKLNRLLIAFGTIGVAALLSSIVLIIV